jgi:hypothetical protein
MSIHRLREPALVAALGEECGPPWYKECELLSAGRQTVSLIDLADLAID